MSRAHLALLVLLPLAGRAQSPEAGWTLWPGGGARPPETSAPPPPATLPPLAVEPAPEPAPEVPSRLRAVRAPEPPNAVSMRGATPLGPWIRGELLSIGFPLIALRFLLGLGPSVDVGVGFDSFYLVMNEPRLAARVLLLQVAGWSVGASLEAGYAFFTVSAPREARGPRWLTGRRNLNLVPALVASYQGPHPRAVRIFARLEYLLALDLEPFITSPLQPAPAGLAVGHNVTMAGGLEVPLSSRTSFLFSLGLQVHGREPDSRVMPEGSVGLVTSF